MPTIILVMRWLMLGMQVVIFAFVLQQLRHPFRYRCWTIAWSSMAVLTGFMLFRRLWPLLGSGPIREWMELAMTLCTSVALMLFLWLDVKIHRVSDWDAQAPTAKRGATSPPQEDHLCSPDPS